MSVAIIQQIGTKWTKASRGGANAVKRNAVPEVATVPVHRVQADHLVVLHHSLFYGERTWFSEPFENIAVNPPALPLVIGCVTITRAAEEVAVTFQYNRKCGGAPERGWAHKTMHLGLNMWGQVVYNGRFAPGWEGDWWYEKVVVNIGLFERITPGVFTCSEPTDRFRAMGQLF